MAFFLPSVLKKEGPPPGASRGKVAREQRCQRPSVDTRIDIDASQLGEGRRQIDVARQLVDDRSLPHPRAAHDQRHANVLLVGSLLARKQPMLAQMVSVVGSEEDVGVVELACGLERLEQRGDQVLHSEHRLQPPPVGLVYPCDLMLRERRLRAQPRGLVQDVGFIEGRRVTHEEVREGRSAIRQEKIQLLQPSDGSAVEIIRQDENDVGPLSRRAGRGGRLGRNRVDVEGENPPCRESHRDSLDAKQPHFISSPLSHEGPRILGHSSRCQQETCLNSGRQESKKESDSVGALHVRATGEPSQCDTATTRCGSRRAGSIRSD